MAKHCVKARRGSIQVQEDASLLEKHGEHVQEEPACLGDSTGTQAGSDGQQHGKIAQEEQACLDDIKGAGTDGPKAGCREARSHRLQRAQLHAIPFMLAPQQPACIVPSHITSTNSIINLHHQDLLRSCHVWCRVANVFTDHTHRHQ